MNRLLLQAPPPATIAHQRYLYPHWEARTEPAVFISILPVLFQILLGLGVFIAAYMMLGSRTKQVNCYGKRGQRRVISTSAEKKAFSPFLDPDTPTPLEQSPAKPKPKRENLYPAVKLRKVSSPKVVIPVRKRSPLTKPIKHAADKPKPLIASVFKLTHNDTPTRTPLSVFHPNTPGSPAIPAKHRHRHISPKEPAATKRQIAPFVDVDITTFNDDGYIVKKENWKQRISLAEDSDDADFVLKVRRPPRKMQNRIVSDDSDSENETEDQCVVQICSRPSPAPVPIAHSRPVKKALTRLDSPKVVDLTRDTRSPSPVAPFMKPRPLTPVRPGRNRLFVPVSPWSQSDSDGFSDMELYDDDRICQPAEIPEIPIHLRPLLAECQQDLILDFSSFISAFPHDPIISAGITGVTSLPQFRKVGEASYSEVFGIGSVVLKIIPIRDEAPLSKLKASQALHRGSEEEEPAPTDAHDVLKEIIVTRAMGSVHSGFVKLEKAYVVKGRYPQDLLKLWDEYAERKVSESIRPDMFSLTQVYAIIVLPNGGLDLESYGFKTPTKTGWRQASSIFWQVAKSLAHAEQLVSFEHRDLHLGQILVNDLLMPTTLPLQAHSQNRKVAKTTQVPMDDRTHGVEVTLIDLGLSRMDAGDGAGGEMIHWTSFDEEIFQGEGDYQFDIYRMMRDQNRDDWEAFKPLSNVMWLHYLLTKLLKSKGIKAPRKPTGTTPSGSGFSERDCYECLIDLEQWLGKCVVAAAAKVNKPVKGKGRRKTLVSAIHDDISLSPLCAGEIVEYGVKKRWIKPIFS